MSPEQCASSGAVDARSDLYSLGCIFYELVCGRPPFGHGGLELIASHLRDVPPPPRAKAPWVPPAIEQVVLRLLEKQPERRLPSCAALIAALDEAARVLGLPGGSVPHLAAGGAAASAPGPAARVSAGAPADAPAPGPAASAPAAGPAGSAPGVFAGSASHPSRSTLGSAAGAASMVMVRRRGAGVWLGLAAVVVVGGVVTAAVVLGEGRSGRGDTPSTVTSAAAVAPGEAGVAAAAAPVPPGEAGVVAAAPAATPASADPDAAAAPANVAPREATAPDAPPVATGPESGPAKPHQPAQKLSPRPRMKEQEESGAPAVRASTGRLTQAELAEAANEEGRKLMAENRYGAAASKFQEAVARVPDAKYFFNLAVARTSTGYLDDAITALDGMLVASPPPSPELVRKAGLIRAKIFEIAKANGAPPPHAIGASPRSQ